MALVGYCRVSTSDQSLDIQIEQLTAAGCKPIFQEKKSGTKEYNRPELAACLNYVRDGDTLLVTRLDRLARSMSDLFKIMGELERKECKFKCLLQPEIDTTTTNGRLIMGILAVIAQFETEVRSDRQREGIEAAKARGVYTRQSKNWAKMAVAERSLKRGLTYREAAAKIGLSEDTLRRRLPGYEMRGPRRVLHTPDGLVPLTPSATLPPSAAEAVEAETTPKPAPSKHGLFGSFRR